MTCACRPIMRRHSYMVGHVHNEKCFEIEIQKCERCSMVGELVEALSAVLHSACPSPKEQPSMFAAWETARTVLAKARKIGTSRDGAAENQGKES